ncbi:MAG: hypothetical protein ACYTG0_21710 [Planctomycetota bacterium]|jgi:hypothetical protein
MSLSTVLAFPGLGAGAWCYMNRNALTCLWRSYRVGAAETFEEARTKIAWFESGRDCKRKLRALVDRWATGNRRFDFHVARYVRLPESSELMRKTFSLGFAWHEERLPDWAHYWSWQAAQEPDERIASIVSYLDVLLACRQPRAITWREVLDLQAVFQLTGRPRLAKRLDPENWPDRYRRWRDANPGAIAHVDRPVEPLPE